MRNSVIEAEVADLKQGTAAIEERARSELGMVRRDEVFFSLSTKIVQPRQSHPRQQLISLTITP